MWTYLVIGLVIVPLSLILSVFWSVTFLIVFNRWKYRHIPGPKYSSFYLGHIRDIRKCHESGEFYHDLFLKWAQEFGPLFKWFALHRVILVPTGTTIIREIMHDQRKFPKSADSYGRLFKVCGERFMGMGLVTVSDPDKWCKRRAVFNPAFHKTAIVGMMDKFNKIGDSWVEFLSELASNQTLFCMTGSLSRVTLECIASIAFSLDLDCIKSPDSPFPQAVMKVLEGMTNHVRDPLLMWKMSKRKLVQEVREAILLLRDCGQKCVEQRIQALNACEHIPNDSLALIINKLEKDPDVTLEAIIDEFLTFFIAGHETTSNILAFLLGEVGRNPQILHRLREEVDQVVGTKQYISYEDLTKLQYMQQVFCETLRMYPPAVATARQSPQQQVVGGYKIPANALMVISIYVVHRLPQHFPNPNEFDPNRFSRDIAQQSSIYMPFSLGQRSCIGQRFATMESKMLLCKFLQRFNYHLDPKQSFEIHETSTIRPRGGTMMTLTFR